MAIWKTRWWYLFVGMQLGFIFEAENAEFMWRLLFGLGVLGFMWALWYMVTYFKVVRKED